MSYVTCLDNINLWGLKKFKKKKKPFSSHKSSKVINWKILSHLHIKPWD